MSIKRSKRVYWCLKWFCDKGKGIRVVTVKSMVTQFLKRNVELFHHFFCAPWFQSYPKICSSLPSNYNPFFYYDKAMNNLHENSHGTQMVRVDQKNVARSLCAIHKVSHYAFQQNSGSVWMVLYLLDKSWPLRWVEILSGYCRSERGSAVRRKNADIKECSILLAIFNKKRAIICFRGIKRGPVQRSCDGSRGVVRI